MDFELTREQRDIKRAAREFSRGEFTRERAIGYEKDHEFPEALLEQAGELGFIGLDNPTEVGGGGLGVTENVLVIEEFCKADSGIGMALHLAFLPAKIEYRGKGGSTRVVEFKEIRLNPELASNLYTMQIPAGFTITTGFGGMGGLNPGEAQ